MTAKEKKPERLGRYTVYISPRVTPGELAEAIVHGMRGEVIELKVVPK